MLFITILKTRYSILFGAIGTLIFCSFFITGQPAVSQSIVSETSLSLEITDIEWVPNSPNLTVAAGNKVVLFDRDLQILAQFEAHIGKVTSLAWKSNGQTLATSGGVEDGTIKIWVYDIDNHTFTLNRTITSEFDYPITLLWSPDGGSLFEVWADFRTSDSTNLHGVVFKRDTTTWDLALSNTSNLFNPNISLMWDESNTKIIALGKAQSMSYIAVIDGQTLTNAANGYSITRHIDINGFTVMGNQVVFGSISEVFFYSLDNGAFLVLQPHLVL